MLRIAHRIVIAIACTLALGCQRDGGAAGANAGADEAQAAAPAGDGDSYFHYTIDGTPFEVPAADVLASLQFNDTFKIFAGADGQRSVVLTIPEIPKCPCRVAAGSTDAGSEIGQGSVSLQNHPEPGNGLNNWYVGQPGTPAETAIDITDTGSIVDGARYVSGTFRTTVLATESNGDGPGNRDYALEGRFRVRFETTGVNGF